MSGKIFVNYRRGDDPGNTGRLYDRLVPEFGKDRMFMDVEGHIQGGDDFVDVLKAEVARSDVLLAIIGPRWLEITDELGRRRLDNPEDWVRVEIASALKSGKKVIPVLVGGASIPRAEDLPDDLKPLARRHAILITLERFNIDVQGLVGQIKAALADVARKRQLAIASAAPTRASAQGLVQPQSSTVTHPTTAAVRTESKQRQTGNRLLTLGKTAWIAVGLGTLALVPTYLWVNSSTTNDRQILTTNDNYTIEERRALGQIMAAFGGVSPIVGRNELMSASDPKYLRFKVNFNDPVLQASKTVSHPQSGFLVENHLKGLDKSDTRSSMAHFVLDKNFALSIVLQIGYVGRNYKSFTARFETNGAISDVPLKQVFGEFYVVEDRPFDRVTVFGGQPSERTKLYGLEATPRLKDRTKFFQAIEKAIKCAGSC